jgi:poly(A) polymerase
MSEANTGTVLPRQNWLVAPSTRAVVAALETFEADASRFVGGCVRNALLGEPVDDIDIATKLTPHEVIAAAKTAGLRTVPTGIEHGTVTVLVDHTPFEVTTLRRDVETDGRHAKVAFSRDWAEDAARRDFYCNALYANAAGEVFDPTGGGLADIAARRVRFIGDPEARLTEDHLRSLRFFRFSAWYGRAGLDKQGLAACERQADGLKGLSVERVWKELKKLLSAPEPTEAVLAMLTTGLLGRIIQSLDADAGRVFTALVSFESDAFLPVEPMQRLAALLPADPEVGKTLARQLKLSNAERDRMELMLGQTPRVVSFLSPREVRQALYALGQEGFCDRVKLGWARSDNPRQTSQWRALLAMAEGYRRPALPIDGRTARAAGVPDGPLMRQVLGEVEAWWVDNDFPDDPLAVVERLKSVTQALVKA